MSYQFSIWLDDKTAKDLEALSCFEERKRGAMVKLLIKRAARQLSQASPDATLNTNLISLATAEKASKQLSAA